MASQLETTAAAFRRGILADDAAAAAELVRAYGVAWREVSAQLDALFARMQAARDAGQEITPGWLLAQQRLETIQAQVQAQIARFAAIADTTITAQQVQLVQAARQQAEALLGAALGPAPAGVAVTFNRVPTAALQELVGTLQDGSPLRALLNTLGPEASTAVRQTLIAGVGTGQGPAAISRGIRQQFGGNLVRALTIARTESLQAYRSAALQTYAANADVVRGWRWLSARSSRTCPACLARDGQLFPTTTTFFPSHPRCRCSPVPVTRTWAELGVPGAPESAPAFTDTAADWFAQQTEDVQQQILGPSAFRAYQAGTVTLQDFLGEQDDPRWGPTTYTRSLVDILGTGARQFY